MTTTFIPTAFNTSFSKIPMFEQDNWGFQPPKLIKSSLPETDSTEIDGTYKQLLVDNRLPSPKPLSAHSVIAYPAHYAKALERNGLSGRVCKLVQSHVMIPVVKMFACALSPDEQRVIAQKYNELLLADNRQDAVIEETNGDAQIFDPTLYAQACEATVDTTNQNREKALQAISSFKADRYTKTFFAHLHTKNIMHQANIRGEINYRYNQLVQEKHGHEHLIPGGENLEELGMDTEAELVYPELYARSTRDIRARHAQDDTWTQTAELAKQVVKEKLYTTAPKAPCGITEVYLPESLPVAIKLRPRGVLLDVKKKQLIQKFCDYHGWDALIVPKVDHYEGVLIEKRLNIHLNLSNQMAFYALNANKMNKAVKQFVEFSLTYGTGDLQAIFEVSEGYLYPRFDNIPMLYNEETQEYCIGLIDVEQFGQRSIEEWIYRIDVDELFVRFRNNNTKNLSNLVDRLVRLVSIFPNNVDVFIEVYKERINEKYLESDVEMIKQAALPGQEYFKRFIDHSAYLESNGVIPAKPLTLTQEQETKLAMIKEKPQEERAPEEKSFLKLLDFLEKRLTAIGGVVQSQAQLVALCEFNDRNSNVFYRESFWDDSAVYKHSKIARTLLKSTSFYYTEYNISPYAQQVLL